MNVQTPLFRHGTRRLPVLALLILTGLSVMGCGYLSLGRKNADSQLENIERNIKARLHMSDEIDAAALRVSLDGPMIILNGFVGSRDEGEHVESVVRKLYPNNPVLNRLLQK